MRRVQTKEQMYALLRAGCFGNCLRVWDSLEQVLASGYSGLVGLRCLAPGGPFEKRIPLSLVPEHFERLAVRGWRPQSFVLTEWAPDQQLTLQGEVCRSLTHYELRWSSEKTDMRTALRRARIAFGLDALHLLRSHMDAASYDDLQELLDLYRTPDHTPDHVVEFSCFSTCVGLIPGRNTVIWEVRAY